MKKHLTTQLSQAINTAVLSSSNEDLPLAVLTAEISVSNDDGWQQLLPAGQFTARDGRPHDTNNGCWFLDKAIAERMIAATKAISSKVVIDYEHQTLHAEDNGQPAIASGWLTSETDLEWREGEGLFIKPDWTPKAKEHIANKEYAFLSAVFPYNKHGHPLYLRMAALTNDPGVVNMKSVAALSANPHNPKRTHSMNEYLKKLLEALGIEVGDATELTEELLNKALDAINAQKDKASTAEDKVAELSAKGNDVDLTKFVPVETYNGLVSEMAVLKADSDAQTLETVINTARKEGKIIQAEVDYLTQFGEQQGVAALTAMLDKRPAVAALSATQTKEKPPESKNKDELSEAEIAVLNACGQDKEDFLKARDN